MRGLTAEEAADRLGYKTMTVYKKIRLGQINVRRYGRDVRIFEEDNVELFEQRRALLAAAD